MNCCSPTVVRKTSPEFASDSDSVGLERLHHLHVLVLKMCFKHLSARGRRGYKSLRSRSS